MTSYVFSGVMIETSRPIRLREQTEDTLWSPRKMNKMRYGNLLPALLVLAGLAFPAPAQQRMMLPEVSRFFKPDYSVREAEAFEAAFGLDARQKLLLETLLQDYETDFLVGVTKLRGDLSSLQPLPADVRSSYDREQAKVREDMKTLLKTIQEHQSDPDYRDKLTEYKRQLQERMNQHHDTITSIVPERLTREKILSIGESMLARLDPWFEERDRIRGSFLKGLNTILNDEQLVRLPSFERSRRRERYLNQGLLSGESVDVWKILRKMSLDPATSSNLQPMMTGLEMRLDEALQSRNDVMDRAVPELFRALHSDDVSRCIVLFDRELESRQNVRASIDDMARQITAQLPAGKADIFFHDVLRDGYPRLYQPTRTHRLLDRAANLRNLDAETTTSVQQLRALYLLELTDVTDELYQLLPQVEPMLERQRLAQRYALKVEPSQPELGVKLQAGFIRRTEVDQKYRDSLKDLLPEAAWSTLNR